MPLDYGFRLYYNKSILPSPAVLREPSKQDAVGVLELWLLNGSLQNDDLLPELQIFLDELLMAFEVAKEGFQNVEDGLSHASK